MRARRSSTLVRAGLAVFVLLWLLDVGELRLFIPVWLPFLIALGLEVQLFVSSHRSRGGASSRDRGPQAVDRERFGYASENDELILLREGDQEAWIPYAGETPEGADELEREPLSTAPYVGERRRYGALRSLLAGLVVLALVAGAAWYVESQRGWNGVEADARASTTARFSAEAARIAGHPVTIRCDEAGSYVGAVQHADGVAVVGGRLAYLTPEICYSLYRLAFKDDVQSSQTARAIAVLAHESWHLAGVRNEGITECSALQSGVELGQRLGLDEEEARQLMRQQLAENAARGIASEYRVPPECREGGELDRNPDSSEFP